MKSLQRPHVRVAVVFVVFGVLVILQGALLAFADRPLMSTLQINDTYTDSGMCGFLLTVHEQGALRTALYADRSGQVVRVSENWQNVQSTITNPSSGKSLTFRRAGRDAFTVNQDGGFTVYSQGVDGLLTVPGYGAITGQAGNITISVATDGTIQVQQSGFLRDGDFTPACDYLQ